MARIWLKQTQTTLNSVSSVIYVSKELLVCENMCENGPCTGSVGTVYFQGSEQPHLILRHTGLTII